MRTSVLSQPESGNPQSVRLKQVLKLSFAASFSRIVCAAIQNSMCLPSYIKAASPVVCLPSRQGSKDRDRYRPKLKWLRLQQLGVNSSSALTQHGQAARPPKRVTRRRVLERPMESHSSREAQVHKPRRPRPLRLVPF